jgi:hypothetical protein
MTSEGEIRAGTHYALSASISSGNINAPIKENADLLKKIALIVENITSVTSSFSFAESGCTIHFFKSKKVFFSYKPLNKMENQLSKEETSFTILRAENVEFKMVFKRKEHTLTF